MTYRTKTYIAGDWTGNQDLISKLYQWNDSDRWALHFVDAHDLTQARDSSLPCSIKRSLAQRLDASKTFVLVVGSQTNALTKGSVSIAAVIAGIKTALGGTRSTTEALSAMNAKRLTVMEYE